MDNFITKPDLEWAWNQKAKRYKNLTTGEFVKEKTVVEWRDKYIEGEQAKLDAITGRLFAKEITIQQWETEMKAAIKASQTNLYQLSRGGRNAMTPADWGKLGAGIKKQYGYLDKFRADLVSGRYTDQQEAVAAYRSGLYMRSANAAFNQGKMSAYGILHLPAVPGDGSTPCMANCLCWWRIVEKKSEWECYWTTTAKESCSSCRDRSSQWYPFIIAKGND